MIRIEEIIVEQQNKISREHLGGYKYGHDYNILKAILKNHKNKNLVKSLVESLEDNTLTAKVKVWMFQAA